MQTLIDLFSGNTLTLLVFFPALACLPLLFFPKGSEGAVKVYALVASLIELALGVWYVMAHMDTDGSFPLTRDPVIPWFSGFGINYHLVMDGISMPLALLGIFLLPIVFLGSWKGIDKHWPAFAAAMLLLTTGVLGSLFAWDLFLFYVFWEIMLIPMYLIIGIWGGERRIYAAVKFFLFTMAGSLLMLVGILWMAWSFKNLNGGAWSFGYDDMLRLRFPLREQLWLFSAFALAFAVKVPMFPLHTWLPDAHVEAPTGGSVILAGILLKLGTYGFLRFALPLFPQASEAAQPLLVTLAVVGILYGALVSWMQEDMKKLVAYSSIAHLGFVMLGLLAFEQVAWEGALLQMVNHGLSTGALFLLVGMLYDRRHTKKFAEFGGLAKVIPVFAFFLVFSALASVGLPALNGFAGEFLILAGSFKALFLPTILATFGVVLAAVYLLKMLQLTLFGPLAKEENRGLKDLDWREVAALVPLCVFMLWIGLKPETFLKPSRAALEATLAQFHQGTEQTGVAGPHPLAPSPIAPPSAGRGGTGQEKAGHDEIAGVNMEAGR